MGTTDNSAANSAVKNLTNKTDLPTDVERGFFGSPLSGSVGFGGDNFPDDVHTVSTAFVANGRLDQPTFDATDAFNSKIITAQQDMADGLKSDGLINPGGPTENRFANLVQGGMMTGPAEKSIPRPATGSRAGNAAVVAESKADAVDAARTTALQNINDPDRTYFQRAQDMKRLNKAKVDATTATTRAERLDIERREKAQQDQIMAVQKARQQSVQQTKRDKGVATKTAKSAVDLLGNLSEEQAKIIGDEALSDGIVTHAGNDGMSVETGRTVSRLKSDWENLVRRYGGDPKGERIKNVRENDPSQGKKYEASDGTIFVWRLKGSGKPTLDIHLRNQTGAPKKYMIKRRYGP